MASSVDRISLIVCTLVFVEAGTLHDPTCMITPNLIFLTLVQKPTGPEEDSCPGDYRHAMCPALCNFIPNQHKDNQTNDTCLFRAAQAVFGQLFQ